MNVDPSSPVFDSSSPVVSKKKLQDILLSRGVYLNNILIKKIINYDLK